MTTSTTAIENALDTNSEPRLENIATRQKNTRVRDYLFMVILAIAAIVAVLTISTAANAASTPQLTSLAGR